MMRKTFAIAFISLVVVLLLSTTLVVWSRVPTAADVFPNSKIVYRFNGEYSLTVKFDAGKAFGIVADFYVLGSNALPLHLGTRATTSGVVHFTDTMRGRLMMCLTSWNKLVGMEGKGLRFSLIIFADVVRWDGRVDSYLEVVPLNAEYIFKLPSVRAEVKLSNLIYSEDLGITPKRLPMPNSPIEGKCLNLRFEDGAPLCYASRWTLANRVLLEKQFIPTILAAIMKNGDKLEWIDMELFIYPLSKFGIGAPICYALKGGEWHFAGPGWLMNFDGEIEKFYTFRNKELYHRGTLFEKEAIIGVGITGDLFIGCYQKEEKLGKKPWRYVGPDIIIGTFVPYMYRVGLGLTFNFSTMVDNDPTDGEGFLELYLNYLTENKILVAGKFEAGSYVGVIYHGEGREPWFYGLPFSIDGILHAEGKTGFLAERGMMALIGSFFAITSISLAPQAEDWKITATILEMSEDLVLHDGSHRALYTQYILIGVEK